MQPADEQLQQQPQRQPQPTPQPPHQLPAEQLRNVRRIAVLGGESSGKTTLAQELAVALRTVWVAEYGRQRWEELRATLDVPELLAVGRRQVALEDAAATTPPALAAGWIVCDTSPLTTLQYCLYDHGGAPAELHALAQRSYDLTVLCEPDFGFVQDGARRDDSFRAAQHAWTVQRLAEMQVPALRVSGPVNARVQQVMQAVKAVHAHRTMGAAQPHPQPQPSAGDSP